MAASDRFSVVLEATEAGDGGGDDITLDGVYGAAGSGGAVVTGTIEFDAAGGVFMAEYVPFVAGTHLLSVTFQVMYAVPMFSGSWTFYGRERDEQHGDATRCGRFV